MKTNDIFNFRRFGRYFTSDLSTCWSNYGLSLLTISILFPVGTYFLTNVFNLVLRSTWDGPDIGLRSFIFIVATICLVVTMPVKCYGKITEKQYGSFFLTLPASRLEKFVSMFLMTCIIVPVLGFALHLGTDAIICALDHTCGKNLVAGAAELIRNIGDMTELTMNFVDESITIENAALVQDILGQINNPWMYIDEIFGITLPFLLGAIYFKNGKTVKTILVLFAISMASSIIMTPFLENWAAEIVKNANADTNTILQMFNNGIFKNLVLIDTVSDTVFNLALMAGIWFRIKTLKH
ncbi:MAG: hypothetical protein IJ504_05365 [Bacteroidales bacterium]|nr:hypothetical protein [Bacteroidales bacterium]